MRLRTALSCFGAQLHAAQLYGSTSLSLADYLTDQLCGTFIAMGFSKETIAARVRAEVQRAAQEGCDVDPNRIAVGLLG